MPTGTDVSLPAERGLAATATNLGYRTAAWFASAVALVIADYFGWRPAFLILAGVMLLFCISTWLAPEPPAIQQPPRSLRETVVIPLQELLAGPGAAALLCVVAVFKIGDAFANKFFTPFMLDTGFSKTERRDHRQAAVHRRRVDRCRRRRRADGAARPAALHVDFRHLPGGDQPHVLRAGGRLARAIPS